MPTLFSKNAQPRRRILKNTPSVFCLIFTLFCCVTPIFAQTEAIKVAENALELAKRDTTNPVPYATALRDMWQAYRDYLIAGKVETPDTLTVFLINQQAVYQLSMDSLVKAVTAVKGKALPKLRRKIQDKEIILYKDAAESFKQIAVFHAEKQGNYLKSLQYFELLQTLLDKLGDKESYFSNVETLADINVNLGKYEVAQSILEKAITILNQELAHYDILPKKDKDKPENKWLQQEKSNYISLIAMLSDIFKEKGNLEASVLNSQKAIYLMQECLKDTTYKAVRYNAIKFGFPQWRLAKVYYDNYKLDSAILIANEALLFYPKVSEEHSLLAPLLALSYKYKGDMVNFRKMVMEAYEFAREGIEKSLAINTLTAYYTIIGQYNEVLKWEDEDAKNCLKLYGKDTEKGDAQPNYSKGIFYSSVSEFDKAEKCFRKAMSIYKNLGANTRILVIEDGLAGIYQSLGQYNKALDIRRQIHKSKLETSSKSSIDILASWSSLGFAYQKLRNLDSAQFCYEKCYDIAKNNKKTPEFVSILSMLGSVSEMQHDYNASQKWYQEAQSYADSLAIFSPILKGSWLTNLSRILRKCGKLPESLEKSEKSLVIQRANERPDFYRKALLNRALLHDAQQQNTAAADSLQSLFQNIQTRIIKEFAYLSEQDKVAFMTMLDNDFFGTMQAAYARLYTKGEAAKSGALFYNTVLLQKELSLVDTRSLKRKASVLNDTLLFAQLFKLNTFEEQIKSDKPIPMAERQRLTTEIAQIRADLEEKYPKLFEKDWTNINWQSVQSKLKPNEIAIEFADVLNNDDDTTHLRHYYAVVLRGNSPYPVVVPLFEEQALVNLLDASEIKTWFARKGKSDTLQVSESETIKTRYGSLLGTKLYRLVWQPLENTGLLRGVKTVHYAPSGLLNRVAFAALPIVRDTLQRLMEFYQLRQYNSTRSIVETPQNRNKTPQEVVVFGDIQYGNCLSDSSNTTAGVNAAPSPASGDMVTRSSLLVDSLDICWPYLPNGKKEVKNIVEAYQTLQPTTKITTWTGYNATEARLKTYGVQGKTAPTVFHFSSHGYANATHYPESRYAPATLHRAGIAMAGVNWTTCCPRPRSVEDEDNIITAHEISQLNLSQTELVVLSGCQTGLGEIGGREGVFGMVRGFKLAGAQNVIASLWQVPDKETGEFMTAFYKHYLSGKSLTTAFEATRQEMRQLQSIYSWGAWVLLK